MALSLQLMQSEDHINAGTFEVQATLTLREGSSLLSLKSFPGMALSLTDSYSLPLARGLSEPK